MAVKKDLLSVDVSALGLADSEVDRIALAVQKAVLHELASIDTAPSFVVEVSRPNASELTSLKTKGIVIKEVPKPREV